MTTTSTHPDLPLRSASPLTAYARFWQRYAVFSGRASLSEYWWAVLLDTVVVVVLAVVTGVLIAIGSSLNDQGAAIAALPTGLGAVFGLLTVAYVLAQIVPAIAIAVRRLHDADLSGFFYLLSLLPSVGGLILLVLHLLPSSPRGARFDRGATAWTPAYAPVPMGVIAPPAPAPPPPPPSRNGGFDTWPAPVIAPTVTAQLPVSAPADGMAADVPTAPADAVRRAWETVGAVRAVRPRLTTQPSWRRQGYLLVRGTDGIDVLTTTGLGSAEGATALGPGAEVYLAGRDLGQSDDDIAAGWRFAVVASVARRIGASGMHLPAELEQYGALSMTVAADAPEDWRTPDGTVGVLIGVGLPSVPDSVTTDTGELRLVGIAALRPEELQRILDGGRAARTELATRLAALPPEQLVAPDRPAV